MYPVPQLKKYPIWCKYEPFEEYPDDENPQSQRQSGQQVPSFGVLHPGSWVCQIRPGYVVWQPKSLVPKPGWKSSHVWRCSAPKREVTLLLILKKMCVKLVWSLVLPLSCRMTCHTQLYRTSQKKARLKTELLTFKISAHKWSTFELLQDTAKLI